MDFAKLIALQNGLPYKTDWLTEGKKNLAGFFVDNRNLRIFKASGRVKPRAQRLCNNRSHKDDCIKIKIKIAGLDSNNSCGTFRSQP